MFIKSASGRFSFAVLNNPTNRHLLSVFLLLFLSGCASGSLLSDVSRALYQQQFGSVADPTQVTKLNPDYRYLRVEVLDTPPALMVLGYVDADPQGDIEVWYSANKEVIKTQHGRIVGTAGLAFDWRSVHFAETPPAWNQVQTVPSLLVRQRDEMSGYRYGITEQLQLEAVVGVPAIRFSSALPTLLASRYRWYRESLAADNTAALPAAWYAVDPLQDKAVVVYSFQCLSAQLCLSLQRWPIQKAPS